MNIDDNTKAIVEAINGVRSTLWWVCFWLCLILLEMPSASKIVDTLKRSAGIL